VPLNGGLTETLPAVVKLGPSGQYQWRTLLSDGHPEWDGALSEAIEITKNGTREYVVVGSKRDSATTKKGFIAEVDLAGNPIGPFHYMTCPETTIDSTISFAYTVRQTPDNGFIVAGQAQGMSTGNDMLMAKFDISGSVQWCKTFDGQGSAAPSDDQAFSVRPTYSGGMSPCGDPLGTFNGYVLVGEADLQDVFVVRTDTSGAALWSVLLDSASLPGYQKVFTDTSRCAPPSPPPPTGSDFGMSVEQIDGGDFIIAAEFNRDDQVPAACPAQNEWLDADGALVELAQSNGAVLFAKNIAHFSGDDFTPKVRQTASDLGFVVIGTTADPSVMSDPSHGEELLVVRTDSLGNVIWREPFLGAASSSDGTCGFGIVAARDGGYAVSGNNGDDGDDYVFAKLARDPGGPGLVAWYPDCVPFDRAGLNDGTRMGTAPTCAAESKVGIEALNFQNDDWIQVQDSPPLHFAADMSVELWLKTVSGGTLVQKGVPGIGSPGFLLEASASGLLFQSSDGTHVYSDFGSGMVTDGQWHHVAVTLADVAPMHVTITLYIDQTIRSSSTRTLGSPDSGAPLLLGASGTPPNVTTRYQGIMDEIKIFDRPLPAPEVFESFDPLVLSSHCTPHPQSNTYCLNGSSDHVSYSWWIDLWNDGYGMLGPEPFNLAAIPIALGAHANAMAIAFASSINAVSPGTATSAGDCFTITKPVDFSLWVGATGLQPTCKVTTAGCTYNPTIRLQASQPHPKPPGPVHRSPKHLVPGP
jgi:hypothetical protein